MNSNIYFSIIIIILLTNIIMSVETSIVEDITYEIRSFLMAIFQAIGLITFIPIPKFPIVSKINSLQNIAYRPDGLNNKINSSIISGLSPGFPAVTSPNSLRIPNILDTSAPKTNKLRFSNILGIPSKIPSTREHSASYLNSIDHKPAESSSLSADELESAKSSDHKSTDSSIFGISTPTLSRFGLINSTSKKSSDISELTQSSQDSNKNSESPNLSKIFRIF